MTNQNLSKKEIVELVSDDTKLILSNLLLYKLASKNLSPYECNTVIDSGANTMIDELSKHIDKNIVEKIVKDTAINMKENIQALREAN